MNDLANGLESRLLVFDNITGGVDEHINDADPTALLGPLGRIFSGGTPVVAIAHRGKQSGPGPGKAGLPGGELHGYPTVQLPGVARFIRIDTDDPADG